MLDILAEILIDLFQGKDPKKKAQSSAPPRGNPASQPPRRADGWPDRSADDPYIKDHPSDFPSAAGAEEPSEGSIADILRRMHDMAAKGGAGAPVLVPGYDKPPPRPAEARPHPKPQAKKPPSPKPQPQPRPQPSAPTPAQVVTYAPPAPGPRPASLLDAPVSAPARDYAALLRNNPDAARQAFVFSEIFGRPLGERE